MINIEIKARCADPTRLEKHLHALGAGQAGTFHQKDSYFKVDEGRLKLREMNGDEAHLIYYRRDDQPGPRRSDYEIASTSDPAALNKILERLMGTWVEVEKTRHVWIWENVRIHLDEVKSLGSFVELEAVIDPDSADQFNLAESQERVETLMRALEIGSDQLVSQSYGDLILSARTD
jgi:adenylate cyclase, class 2